MFLIIIFVLLFQNSYLFSTSIEVEPVKLDFLTIDKVEESFVITASKGYILKYDVNQNRLTKIKVFDQSAPVIKIFHNNNKYYAFNSIGQMSIANTLNQKWETRYIKNMNLLSVLMWKDDFLLRSKEEVLKISNNGEILANYPLKSKDLERFNEIFTPNYQNSMTIFNEKLYIESDSNKILVFDNNLKLIDSLNIFETLMNIDSLKYGGSLFKLANDGNYLFLAPYWTNQKWSGYAIMLKVDKEHKIKIDTIVRSNFYTFKLIDGKLHKLTFDKSYIDTNLFSFSDKIGEPLFKNQNFTNYYFRLFNDFYVDGTNLWIVGYGGILEVVDSNKNVNVVNETFWLSENIRPLVLNDDKLIFKSGTSSTLSGRSLYPFFYIYNFSDPIKTKLNIKNVSSYNEIKASRFYNIEFDSKANQFNLFGVLYSSDYYPVSYDTLLYNNIARFSINSEFNDIKFERLLPPISKDEIITPSKYGSLNLYDKTISLIYNVDFSTNEVMKINNNYYITNYFAYHPIKKEYYTSFTITDNEYRAIDKYDDSTYVMDFVFLHSFDKFLAHCANTSDSGLSEIKYTENRGLSWNYVHKYDKDDTLITKYYIKLNDNDYLILFHFDGYYSNSTMYMDLVDLKTFTWARIRQWDLKKEDRYFTSVGIYSDGNIMNFAIGDTLYYIKDLYDYSSWQYRILPNKGKMFDPLTKIGNKFISGYRDMYGYLGLCIISFSDTNLLSINEYEINRRNYLYTKPPYPIPVSEKVYSEIYWDTALDIKKAQIKIYNIYGEEIKNEGNIEIIPVSDWHGKLIWNCEGIESGVYLITITYGTERKAIKVIKD